MTPKILSGLLLASLSSFCWGNYVNDYDYGHRAESEHDAYDASGVPVIPVIPVERAHYPTSDTSGYHLFHRDSRPVHETTNDFEPSSYSDAGPYHNDVSSVSHDQPESDHKHHTHDHGTSSMSFYQKVKHHEYKFKLNQKHGKKHGNFHGYAHPYAYGGLKVHDF